MSNRLLLRTGSAWGGCDARCACLRNDGDAHGKHNREPVRRADAEERDCVRDTMTQYLGALAVQCTLHGCTCSISSGAISKKNSGDPPPYQLTLEGGPGSHTL